MSMGSHFGRDADIERQRRDVNPRSSLLPAEFGRGSGKRSGFPVVTKDFPGGPAQEMASNHCGSKREICKKLAFVSDLERRRPAAVGLATLFVGHGMS
jgi:hypothetical protein